MLMDVRVVVPSLFPDEHVVIATVTIDAQGLSASQCRGLVDDRIAAALPSRWQRLRWSFRMCERSVEGVPTAVHLVGPVVAVVEEGDDAPLADAVAWHVDAVLVAYVEVGGGGGRSGGSSGGGGGGGATALGSGSGSGSRDSGGGTAGDDTTLPFRGMAGLDLRDRPDEGTCCGVRSVQFAGTSLVVR